MKKAGHNNSNNNMASTDGAFVFCVILGVILIIIGFVVLYWSGPEHGWTGLGIEVLGWSLLLGPFVIDAATHGGKTGTSPYDKRRGRRWKGGGGY